MSLLQMTLAGGAMVLAVVLARALLLNRLPKATFIVLWALVAVRLLVPVSIPSPWSAASLLQGIVPAPAATSEAEPTYDARPAQSGLTLDVPAPFGSSATTINAPETNPVLSPTTPKDASAASAAQNPAASDATSTTTVPSTSNPSLIDNPQAENPWNFEAFSAALPVVWVVGSVLCAGGFALVYLRCRRDFATSLPVDDPRAQNFEAFSAALPVVWVVGSVLCAGGFALVYLRCRRDFATSLPVDDPRAQAWLAEHRGQLRRPLSLRQSDLISTPLTYGVVHPVILVPRDTDWSREGEVRYVLAHELVHVRRFDALTKFVLMVCVCVHWFNPLVWAMYVLANRDLELSCDERVVRGFGTGSRADYARALIAMEETKSGLAPLYSGFSKTATEERIVAIMHIKKTSLLALATSASLVVGIPAALATSALPQRDVPQTDSDQPAATAPLAAASSYDTSAWGTVVSSTYYSADDWALVEALNVPGVEDLTVAEFTDLALEVADTPEKLDTLLLFMDDPDIAAQASTNGAANFVANVVTPVLRENSRFPVVVTPVLRENSRFPVTASYGGATEAHWTGVTTLVSTDAVVGDGEEEALPLLGNALAEAGYGGGEMCYAINAHVLDADAVTVGEYVQTIADTRHAVDDLVGWDLTPTWDRDAGEKLTVALEDIAQNQSSDALLVEASWFFVDGTDGGATLSDTRETNDDRDATAALLATYVPLGLSYSEEVSAGGEPVLTMEFAGRFPVTASYGGATEAHWTGVTTLVSTDAVVGDGEEEALPLLGNALAEAGYGGGEMCYAINAHVLDADAVTVGEYVQTIADTRHAVDDLVGWDLTPTWDRDAGEKLTVALEDIAQNQSSDALLVEASWFFVDGTDGGATLSDTRETNDDRDATAALLATYVPLGLSYSEEVSAGGEPVLTMEFAGSPVRSVYDEHLGVWIANSMNEFRYGDEGVDLVVVYDGDQAVGLRASSEQEQGKLDSQRAAVTVALEPVDDGVTRRWACGQAASRSRASSTPSARRSRWLWSRWTMACPWPLSGRPRSSMP